MDLVIKENFGPKECNVLGKFLALMGIMMALGIAHPAQADGGQNGIADIIIVNADVKTVDPHLKNAEAFAIKDGRFQAVGSTLDIQKLAGDTTRVIDAKGATVIPGFIDGHLHLQMGMTLATGADLNDIVSKADWIKIVAEKISRLKDGEWLLGGGWNHALSDGILPTKEMLDVVSPNNPVFLSDIDGHTSWVNTKALVLAGITADSDVPDGGKIMLDPTTGEPTGILKEGARNLISVLPGFQAANDPAVGVPAVIALANSYGITSVHDMSPDNGIYADLAEQGKLNMRIWSGRLSFQQKDYYARYAAQRDAVKKRLAANGLKDRGPIFEHGYSKLMVDGVLSTYTALMKNPYSDNADANPEAIMNEDFLLQAVRDSHENGFPVAIHAIGDRGVQMALDAFEKAGHPEGMLPDRIEHIEVVTPDDLARFKSLGIVASMQPIHATCCVGDYVISRIGADRMPNAYPWRKMLDKDIHLSLSSDWPTSPLNPLAHISNAMRRDTRIDGEVKPWDDASQALTFEEALYAYIQSSANLTPWGDQTGSITVGKWADFVIMDVKIDVKDADSVAAAKVLSTYLAGEAIYQK